MTTKHKPKTVTIPQAEYSALLGVVAAHRADAGKSPSKVLEYYDSVARKPAPEVDHEGRVYYVEAGKVYEGRPSGISCKNCEFCEDGKGCLHRYSSRRDACSDFHNGDRGHRTLHPVQAVG